MKREMGDSVSSKQELIGRIIKNLTEADCVDVVMSICDTMSQMPEQNIEIRIRKAGNHGRHRGRPFFDMD